MRIRIACSRGSGGCGRIGMTSLNLWEHSAEGGGGQGHSRSLNCVSGASHFTRTVPSSPALLTSKRVAYASKLKLQVDGQSCRLRYCGSNRTLI